MWVFWTELADEDLDTLVSYVAEDSVATALTLDAMIRDAARMLVDFPESGKVGRVPNTRELVVARYRCVLVYRLEGEQVQILRLIHGGQQWPEVG